ANPDYSAMVNGATLVITSSTQSFVAQFVIKTVGNAAAAGVGTVTAQLVFTSANWATPQTVTVFAIDNNFVDGSDKLVFAPFVNQVNAIRGPITVDGGIQVGEESTLSNPFMLPGETNLPLPDGVRGDTNSGASLTDILAIYRGSLGERPGFD